MKRIPAIILAILMLVSSAVAEAITVSGHSPLVVGTDLPAGTYKVTAAEVAASTAVTLLDQYQNVLGLYSLSDSVPAAILPVIAGQQLIVMSGAMVFTPLSADEVATANEADPYLQAVPGVDLHAALAVAASVAMKSGAYPLLDQIMFDYNGALHSLSMTLLVSDDASPANAQSYALAIPLLLNACCVAQNNAVAPASDTYLGGIYDALGFRVTVYKSSDRSAPLLHISVPKGTQGAGTFFD